VFTALLDTCVLWPNRQRDFLLSLAIEGAYRPIWSDVILEELEYEEARKLVGRGKSHEDAEVRASKLIAEMRGAFADAEVTGWEGLEGSFGLPDPDDEHVVSAAVIGGAGAIVTANIKDFPSFHLPLGLTVLPPAEFAANTVEIDPERGLIAVERMAQRSGKQGPKQSVTDILGLLEVKYHMVRAVAIMKDKALR
jgi:hypothetical protein